MRIVLFLLLFLPFSGFSQGKKTISHADLWSLKGVGNPSLSPDGKWVVFSLTQPDYEAEKRHSDLWLVPTDGSAEPRPITAGKAGESSTAWSPDGSKLLFTAKREGDDKAQVYLLHLREGGEAQRITSLSSGASSPQWHPNGRQLLFTSQIYPDAATDSIQKTRVKAKKDAKVQAYVYDNFPSRSFDHWIDEQKTALFVQALHSDSAAVQLLAGDADFQQRAFQLSGRPCFSPDGSELLFLATTNYTEAAFADRNQELYRISSRGGQKSRIAMPAKMMAGGPVFSPDGALYLQLTPSLDSIRISHRYSRVARFDWPRPAAPAYLNMSMDLDPENLQFTTDGKELWFQSENRGKQGIYRYNLRSNKLLPFAPGHTGVFSGLQLNQQGKTVAVAAWQSSNGPNEIYLLDPSKNTFKALTSFNQKALEKLDLPRLLEFESKTPGFEQNIHSYVVLPPGFDSSKKYPLWVVMHGGPHSAWQDSWHTRWNYHLLAKPGYVLLLTNYRGSTGYGQSFAQAIHLDPFKGPANDILEAAKEAIKLYRFIDESKQVAGGASYGGHLAGWMLGTTTHFKCLISHAGLINSYSQWATSDGIFHREISAGGVPWGDSRVWTEQNPISFLPDFKTPMLLTIGEKDYRVPINNTLEAWSILQRQKIPSRLVVFPNENHWVQDGRNHEFFVNEMHAWIAKWLE